MILLVLVYSFVQAVTEFLPVSSSGHLVLLHTYLPLEGLDELSFDVALHWGTLVAVIAYFWQDLRKLFFGFLRSLRTRSLRENPDGRLAWLMIVGNIIPVIVGASVGTAIESATRLPWVVAITLFLGALLLLLTERMGTREKALADISLLDAVLVGASQVIAFVPGASRSGVTIITALSRKMNRVDAVRMSFLFSLPIIFAAGVGELLRLPEVPQGSALVGVLLGILASGVFGYIVIRFLLRFIARNTFLPFAYYRIILALGIGVTLLL